MKEFNELETHFIDTGMVSFFSKYEFLKKGEERLGVLKSPKGDCFNITIFYTGKGE